MSMISRMKRWADGSFWKKALLAAIGATISVVVGWTGGFFWEAYSIARADEKVEDVEQEVEKHGKEIDEVEQEVEKNKTRVKGLREGQKRIIDRIEGLRGDLREDQWKKPKSED